jgi:tetratricopeptide (TPR) repeat protein
MLKLLNQINDRLRSFVDQRDDIVLVVRCHDEEIPVVLKLLEGMDEASTAEMFWVMSDSFTDAASYVSALVATFAATHGAVRTGMPEMGMTPWPELPAAILDGTRPPDVRLRELMVFSRTLLPALDGFIAVWCLIPLEVGDPTAYATLIAQVVAHDFPLPWCHHLRIIVRTGQPDIAMPTALAQTLHVAWYEPDLSQEAIRRSLEAEVGDASIPLEQRLQSLFLAAGVDYAFQRFDEAMQKYAVLLKYYAGTQNATMTALVLNAMGETHARLGHEEQAGDCFELAFVPASQAPGPPIPAMLNIVLNLAALRMSQQRWEEGEAYYDSAQQLATAQRDAATKVSAIEHLGHCQYMQGKVGEALASWYAGATVAGELGMPDQRRSMLERLRAHYLKTHDDTQRADIERQLGDMAEPSVTMG